MKARLSLALAIAGLAIFATGCVTTKKFEKAMGDVTTRVDGVQTKVETQSTRIDKVEQQQNQFSQDLQKTNGDVTQVRDAAGNAMTRAEAAEKTARGKIIWHVTLDNKDVRFNSDKFELADSGRQALAQLVDKLKSMDKMVFVEVQGHTDNRGSEAYNEALGMKRAEAVREYLHEQGIPLNLISAVSYGEMKPVADNHTREGRAENRRVEVLVLE